jgi:hypothetical protein
VGGGTRGVVVAELSEVDVSGAGHGLGDRRAVGGAFEVEEGEAVLLCGVAAEGRE